MGYDYYILIQGKDEKWRDLHYDSMSGSYGATDNHYFFLKWCSESESQYNLDTLKEMGEYQQIFNMESMERDYLKYKDRDEDKQKPYFWELEKYYNLCKSFKDHRNIRLVFGITP